MYQSLYDSTPDFLQEDLDAFIKELEHHLSRDVIAQLHHKGLTILFLHYTNGHSIPEILATLINGHGDPSAATQRAYAGLVQEARSILERSCPTA